MVRRRGQVCGPESRGRVLAACDGGASVREAIEVADARLLFLPPCSLDLNPIEQLFAKPKALLRTAARPNVDSPWNAIGTALDAFTPGACRHPIANCDWPHP